MNGGLLRLSFFWEETGVLRSFKSHTRACLLLRQSFTPKIYVYLFSFQMTSNQANSPSNILKKLAKVPLLCNVLEKHLHEETQDRTVRQSSTEAQYFPSSSHNTTSYSYSNSESQPDRRRSFPSWQRSHATTNDYRQLTHPYRLLNTLPVDDYPLSDSSGNLYSMKRLDADVNSGNNPPKESVISHLDLESNYMNQMPRGFDVADSYPQRHSSSQSYTYSMSTSTMTNSASGQLFHKDESISRSNTRRASAPPYLQHKSKYKWQAEDVFEGINEQSFHGSDDKGKHGLKRRHYSEAPQVESRYNYKKMRRTSEPDSIPTSKQQQNHWLGKPSRRSSSPHPVELPFTLDTLTDEIKEISTSNAQSPDLLEKKETLRSVLEGIFRQSFPGCSLHLVGSSVNGFGNKSSDADFCLMLTQWREIDQRREARSILLQLNQLMRRCDFVEKSHVIFATVPIIKFIDRVSKCECDININNRVGIRNTFLMKAYCEVDKRLYPLVMVIKKWAKTHGINEAKDGTLSSYALTLMVIHFLQYGCKPAVLPSLQNMFPDVFSDDGDVTDLLKVDIKKFIQEHSVLKSQNYDSLGKLLLEFFQYFSDSFRWNSSVMSVRLGRVYNPQFGVLPRNKFIFIEEPFDSNNVAKTVYNQANFKKIKMKICLAANKLRISPSLKSII